VASFLLQRCAIASIEPIATMPHYAAAAESSRLPAFAVRALRITTRYRAGSGVDATALPSVPVSYANGKLFEPGGGSRSHDRDRRGNHACFQDETKRDISRKQAEARKPPMRSPQGTQP
jgi:hypothetical protein